MRPGVWICVFAKPPRAGRVKTRLGQRIGADASAELADAFLQDTLLLTQGLGWAKTVIACTGEMPPGRTQGCEVWFQGKGDLGARIERILNRALANAPYAIAIGADSPGLPVEFLEQAYRELRRGGAVLGPCDDGGFYLLAVDRCPKGLLADIPWSREDTLRRTYKRLCGYGLSVQLLPRWFDIDRAEDLERLSLLLADGQVCAPATAEVLRRHAAYQQSELSGAKR